MHSKSTLKTKKSFKLPQKRKKLTILKQDSAINCLANKNSAKKAKLYESDNCIYTETCQNIILEDFNQFQEWGRSHHQFNKNGGDSNWPHCLTKTKKKIENLRKFRNKSFDDCSKGY